MERINYGCWLGSWVIGTDNNVWIAQNVSDLGCRQSSKICWQEPSLKLWIFTTLADILPIVWSSYKCIWRGSLSRDLMNTPDCWYIWRGVAVVAKEKDNTKLLSAMQPDSVRRGSKDQCKEGGHWNTERNGTFSATFRLSGTPLTSSQQPTFCSHFSGLWLRNAVVPNAAGDATHWKGLVFEP